MLLIITIITLEQLMVDDLWLNLMLTTEQHQLLLNYLCSITKKRSEVFNFSFYSKLPKYVIFVFMGKFY